MKESVVLVKSPPPPLSSQPLFKVNKYNQKKLKLDMMVLTAIITFSDRYFVGLGVFWYKCENDLLCVLHVITHWGGVIVTCGYLDEWWGGLRSNQSIKPQDRRPKRYLEANPTFQTSSPRFIPQVPHTDWPSAINGRKNIKVTMWPHTKFNF